MRAVTASGTGTIGVDTIDDPTPGPTDVVVAVDSCGVCGTDLHIVDADYPIATYPVVPGHEIAGTVVAVGAEVARDIMGQFVVVDPVVACGHCTDCRIGHTNLCRNWQGYGVTLPGGFAEYVSVRAVDVEIVPESVPRHWATLVEPLSCVLHALDRIGPVRPGDSALVIGGGPTGLMLTQMLAAAGAVTDVVERVQERRQRATSFGAHRTGSETSDLDQPDGWDLVIEATGSVGGFEAGLAAVRRAGRLHVFGVAGPDARATVSPYDIFARELTITGSQSLQHSLGRAVRVLAHGVLDGDAFVTARVPLPDAPRAFEAVRRGDGLKTQLVPAQPGTEI